jgi:pimeloyl-ACP methyl ester carboxylesterase
MPRPAIIAGFDSRFAKVMVTRVRVPILAMGGIKGLGGKGGKVGQGVSLVAENFEAHTLEDCGHFLPEERPDEIVRQIVAMTSRGSRPRHNQIHTRMQGAHS